jgi:hypothetical protein
MDDEDRFERYGYSKDFTKKNTKSSVVYDDEEAGPALIRNDPRASQQQGKDAPLPNAPVASMTTVPLYSIHQATVRNAVGQNDNTGQDYSSFRRHG